MNRKKFLHTSLLGAGSLLLPSFASCDDSTEPTQPNPTPVLIIGAGMAGLAAAQHLKSKNFTNVTLLEARDRIGGRINTNHSLNTPFDMGASWIHGAGSNNPITSVADKANAQTFATNDESLVVYNAQGNLIDDNTLDNYYEQYLNLLESVADAATTNKSVAQVINELNPLLLNDLIMQYQLSTYAEFDAGGSIDQLSSKYWEDDEAFAGNDVLFPNGYDAVTNYLANGLNIEQQTIVNGINYTNTEVIVNTNMGTFNANYVLCTVPLGVLQNNAIQFTPPLSAAHQQAITKLKMGHVNKVGLVFPSVFWDNSIQYVGYCGNIKGQYPYFMNAKKFVSANMLVTFALGDYGLAMENQTDAQITNDIMEILRKIYGNDIPNPTEVLISRWTQDPFARGSYSFAGLGSLPEHFEAFEVPLNNRVFFAGEHTTHDYRGTVHGAYLSGIREGQKIVDLEN